MEGFTIICDACDSKDINVESWDREYDVNILEITCENCGQVNRHGEITKVSNVAVGQ